MGEGASLGSVSSVFRYAVKSLRGEELHSAVAHTHGLVGDRLWAFRDVRRGELASAKHTAGLLEISAVLEHGHPCYARIAMPDGTEMSTSNPGVNQCVSEFLGKEVTLHPLRPSSDSDHYARSSIAPAQFKGYARELFGLTEDEPLPDLSNLPPEAIAFTSMPGTYFDVLPLHIVLLSEFEKLCRELPGTNISLARFRPNIVLDDRSRPIRSSNLIGETLQIGSMIADVKMKTPRCAMTTHAQGTLPKASEIMRKLVAGWQHSFGVYASIERAGAFGVGDPVTTVV